MSNTLILLELLESVKPDGRCDDCLSEELSITPRQKVNQICRPLHEAGRIVRLKATCSRCGKVKLVNTLVAANDYYKVAPKSGQPVARNISAADIDIEKTRTELVRICRTLWQRSQSEEQPRSISVVINQLRSSGVLPNHQASLMLTLCNLRNVHVYEEITLGDHERAIAFHAVAIIGEWWAAESLRS
jgi:hypothetical protein